MPSILSDPHSAKVRMGPDQNILQLPVPANDNAARRPWLTPPFSNDDLVARGETRGWLEPSPDANSSDNVAKGKVAITAYALGVGLVMAAWFYVLGLPAIWTEWF
jgi:hypothetical protein